MFFRVFIALVVCASIMSMLTGQVASASSISCDQSDIIGRWQFYKFIYEEQERPPITPNLVLQYEFRENGVSHLSWSRTGEPGYCERLGSYIYKDCFVLDRVTWVNPNNTMDCGSDPDMHEGRQTTTQLDVKDGEIRLHLSLGGKPFIYIWKKLTGEADEADEADQDDGSEEEGSEEEPPADSLAD